MKDLLAIITIIIWPVVPLFWIPVHGLSKIFKRLGICTYIMPAVIWPPLAYAIYLNKDFFLRFKVSIPFILQIFGFLLFLTGGILQLWTGFLLGLWGLMGLPEVSKGFRGRLITNGPFSIVRHPTYLAHTLMFLGIFLITEVLAVGIITLLDVVVINLIVIPLEERELLDRFGKEYKEYTEKVRDRFFPLKYLF
jgi:protein-S-isoprenylcysteine O-methyltransferase Ste14